MIWTGMDVGRELEPPFSKHPQTKQDQTGHRDRDKETKRILGFCFIFLHGDREQAGWEASKSPDAERKRKKEMGARRRAEARPPAQHVLAATR